MRIFGWNIKRDDGSQSLPSFAEPINDDGALTVGNALGGAFGATLDLDGGAAKTEAELIMRYRRMSLEPEISLAIDDVVNEAISVSSDENVVDINVDDVEFSASTKKKISEEFQTVLSLLDFSNNAYDIFNRWYVDGRLNYNVIIDEDKLSDGIKEVRYLDPKKVKLVREMEEVADSTGVTLKTVKDEYYLYSDTPSGNILGNNSAIGVSNTYRIAKDSIVRVTSGLVNEDNTQVLSHLHKAIKPFNQLRMLEDAHIIYTLTRAPERRVFYVDVGNLPKARAEQYLHDMMVRHKNKMVYDAATGEISNDRRMMTMTEDFWFPRREGSRSTEIDTLTGGTALGDNDNLLFFQKKLYKSLNVPVTRIEAESMFTMGRGSEISRDEVKFAKFIRRLRARFSALFDKLLEKQLVLKGIITPDDWAEIKDKIRYDFNKDNFFEELKETEILRERINTLQDLEPSIGIFFSKAWVRRNVLRMSDEEIEEMKEEMEKEKEEEPDDEFDDLP